MNGLKLEHVLLEPLEQRPITTEPAMNHAQLCAQALSLAAGLQARGIQRLAVHLEDAGQLAIAQPGAVDPLVIEFHGQVEIAADERPACPAAEGLNGTDR